jgi:hypothetical protein
VIAIAIVRMRARARAAGDCEISACFFSSPEKLAHR